jgi:uncharacterized damage-inducible protein DinB
MAAQPEPIPTGAGTLSRSLLGEFDHEMSITRRTLERTPEDKLGWKPHEKSMSLGQLATHLATLTHWVDSVFNSESFDVATAPRQPELKSREEILSAFDKNAAVARAAIAGASDAEFMKTWSLLAGGKSIFTLPRIGVVRGFTLNHMIHHRGQFSVYLRLNNVPVPSIYGPSADENPFG